MRFFFNILFLLFASYLCLEIPIISELVNEVDKVVEDAEDLLHGGVDDAHLDPCQLIQSRNFICDVHFVITEDGYILAIHHVINPVLIANNKPTTIPVVLQHGLFGSATHWLIGSEGGFAADWTDQVIGVDLDIEGRNAPYLLSNLGYDIWIPNLRGCRYSRNHTYLNPDTDNEFWYFSYEQMIEYDAPTIIDYVLKQTTHSRLGWIGHSMGTTIIFGLLSRRQEYADKIKPFIALAPVAHVGHIKTPLRAFVDAPEVLKLLSSEEGEFNLPKSVLDLIGYRICVLPVSKAACEDFFYIFGGPNPESFNSTRTSAYVVNGFCGTSVWTVVHFGFNIVTNQFAEFDFGTLGNQVKYGSDSPRQYNLSAIASENIILMSSDNDYLSDPTDVLTLKSELKVPYIAYQVPNPKFNHFDFIWGIDVYQQVYAPMVQYLKKFH